MNAVYPDYRIRTIGHSDRLELAAASDREYETLTRDQLEGILENVLDIRVVVEIRGSRLQKPTLVVDHLGNTLALSPQPGAMLTRVDFQPSFAQKLVPLGRFSKNRRWTLSRCLFSKPKRLWPSTKTTCDRHL